MKHILDFLKRLAANNNREWFAAHKEEYLEVKRLTEDLTRRMIAIVATVDADAAPLRVTDCTYRIYRDTRFSVDKTPYKTHIGIFVNPPHGKKSLTCGYYLHLEPGNVFFAAGTIGHPAHVLKALRQSVFDEIDEYRSIVEDAEFLRYFPEIGYQPLKTAPKGFPKDWPFIDYLKPRHFMASGPFVPCSLMGEIFETSLLPAVKQAYRFNRFHNFTIDDFE